MDWHKSEISLHARSKWDLLRPAESSEDPLPFSSGTLIRSPLSTHWATTVLLPEIPAPSLPCHNILPSFLLCHCSCQIGWLCWG